MIHRHRRTSAAAGFLLSGCALLLFALLRRTNLSQFDPALILGSFFLRGSGFLERVFGTIVFPISGMAFGILYELILKTDLRSKERVFTGVRLGVYHWILTGLYLGSLTAIHPVVPEQVSAPGFFGASQGGVTVLAILLGHLAFGATLGLMSQAEASAFREKCDEPEEREWQPDRRDHGHPTTKVA